MMTVWVSWTLATAMPVVDAALQWDHLRLPQIIASCVIARITRLMASFEWGFTGTVYASRA